MLDALSALETTSVVDDQKGLASKTANLARLQWFQDRYSEEHPEEVEKERSMEAEGGPDSPVVLSNPYRKLNKQLEDLARRCAATGVATKAETETLRLFFECREHVVRLLRNFAPVCERLPGLAKLSFLGQATPDAEAEWIKGYGITLSRLHFYYGNSYEAPRDDFPIITRVFSDRLGGGSLYAGLARPQAIYIILPDGNSNQLYRGAVMTYREFVRPNDEPLDDESWGELVRNGQIPAAPPFTRSFCAETDVSHPK